MSRDVDAYIFGIKNAISVETEQPIPAARRKKNDVSTANVRVPHATRANPRVERPAAKTLYQPVAVLPKAVAS
jgi:hypothetical protein